MSNLQRLPDIAERLVLAAQGASPTVRLVGGTGLSLLLAHRHSDDIDLFCGFREDISLVVRAVEDASAALGLTAEHVRTTPSFVRLDVPAPGGVLRVDIAADASQRLVTEDTHVGPVRVESLRDQRANKLIALLGRSELRDLVDLYCIEQAGLPALDGFEDAVFKDGGMDPMWFAWAVSQIELKPLRGMIVPIDLPTLVRFRDQLQTGALDRAGADD